MEGSTPTFEERAAIRQVSSLWWLWVVIGVAWSIIALVILQFDQASVNTVGVIIGLMFLGSAVQQLTIASLAENRAPNAPGRMIHGPARTTPEAPDLRQSGWGTIRM